MVAARPLRDLFTDLTGDEEARTGDPAELLRDNGHPDLPDGLVAEAVVNFADTAPIEIAAHLASYVAAHGPVPRSPNADLAAEEDPSSWLDRLASAPASAEELAGTDPNGLDSLTSAADPATAPRAEEAGPEPSAMFEFGHGGSDGGGLDGGGLDGGGLDGGGSDGGGLDGGGSDNGGSDDGGRDSGPGYADASHLPLAAHDAGEPDQAGETGWLGYGGPGEDSLTGADTFQLDELTGAGDRAPGLPDDAGA